MRLKLCKASAVKEGRAKVVKKNGVSIVLCRLKGDVFALENRCTHDDGPLGSGALKDGFIECPRHGARFDVRTGAVKCMPASYPVESYPVTIVDDQVYVECDE